jgi:hypothetical protein
MSHQNRGIRYLLTRIVNAGTAIEDATKALVADPSFLKVFRFGGLMYRLIFDGQRHIWASRNLNSH